MKNDYVHEIKVSYYIKVGKSTTSIADQALYTAKQKARNNFYSKSGNFDEDVCLPLKCQKNVGTVRFHAFQGCLMYNESVTISFSQKEPRGHFYVN
ncbi:hypothetical protein ACQKMI_08390 [Lysinibacillus sp. NPDC097214]|uniref:hypothetical protein n=1 Tax=Lysinibacillus sp. NPDC097214 TaxID=3390584 RepID=UPI003CFD0897